MDGLNCKSVGMWTMDKTQRRVVKQSGSQLLPVVGATGFITFIGLVLAWAAYMRRYVLHDIPLTAALSGEVHEFRSSVGKLGYYTKRKQPNTNLLRASETHPPLVFIHSINAAASSYEMKPLYEYYAKSRDVYALDLPGFGFSERGNRRYSPRMYRDAINDFIATVIPQTSVDVVGLSLTCEFLAEAALRRPEQFRSLSLISPTGFSRKTATIRASDDLLRILLTPQWRRLLFDTLTSRPSLRFFLKQAQQRELDKGLVHYAYVSSHRPEAEYAPYYFVAGKLFTPTILRDYLALTLPVLAILGQSQNSQYEMLEQFHARKNWRIEKFGYCGNLVHFDDAPGVIAQIDQHLNSRE